MLFGFGLYFFYDYKVGYPKKNEHFFVYQLFVQAHETYEQAKRAGQNPEQWAQFAAEASSELGDGNHPLPETIENPMAWPEELTQPELMDQGLGETWRAYTGRLGWAAKPPSTEDKKNQRKVDEQRTSGIVALVLSIFPLFILIRTMRRTTVLENDVLTAPDGTQVKLEQIRRIDIRKWKTKGLARIEADVDGESKTLRIDGLTYGGFKKEKGEPAEALMQAILKDFNGEVIEYEEEIEEEGSPEDSSTPQDQSEKTSS